ncbi:hypothetical protein [Desulfopila inferna]|uniref:hypothetical protein n=1 Tax=Desulfopila inferna TaxID=468528 RepID=UPI001962CA78|nr:hypothetical protein [Desulfopila inferna]MBM9605826.1 hypothetical protein [Desulfopila inferna]
MQPLSSHLVLVSAPSLEKACAQVKDFFDSTPLVRYDRIEIHKEKCHSGQDEGFAAALQQGLDANTRTLKKFIDDFEKTGFRTIKDFTRVECGYPSKVLHIITHFLDGFLGIDTHFYNKTEDSHGLSDSTRDAIATSPEHYWLIQLDGYSETPEKVSLV